MSTRLIAIVSAAAFLAATPAFAQTLQRAPHRVAAPERQATTQEQQAPMVAERTTTDANAALNQQLELARPEIKLIKVTCYIVTKTTFAYQLSCRDALEPKFYKFVFRRDGSSPWWALKSDDFPEIGQWVMNEYAGSGTGARVFRVYAAPQSNPGPRYCKTEDALKSPEDGANSSRTECDEILGFGFMINNRLYSENREGSGND